MIDNYYIPTPEDLGRKGTQHEGVTFEMFHAERVRLYERYMRFNDPIVSQVDKFIGSGRAVVAVIVETGTIEFYSTIKDAARVEIPDSGKEPSKPEIIVRLIRSRKVKWGRRWRYASKSEMKSFVVK